jgi:hypothetical protein
MAICFTALFIHPDVLQSGSLGQRLVRIGISVAIVLACDAWFARRMGVTIDDHGFKLHYALYRSRVPWSKVTGFEWRRWRSPSTESMWIKTEHGAVRIPTVLRSPGKYVGPLLGSSKLRSAVGGDVDALTTLESALARHGSSGPTP